MSVTTVHRGVLRATGGEGLTGVVRPLTDEETADVDAFLAQISDLDDAGYAAALRVPVATAADIRTLLNGATR